MQDEPTAQMDWLQLQPLLDEELCRLGPVDREAVLLRYFQNKSHREVGAALGLSEDLARKRVERALEKLRASFSRRELGVSSAVLAETLALNSVQAAPAGLATSLASTTLAGGCQTAWVGANWGLFFYLMKTKIIAFGIVLVIGLLLVGAWQWSRPAASVAKQPTAMEAASTPIATPLARIVNPNAAVAAPVVGPVSVAVRPHSTGGTDPAAVDPRTDLTLAIRDILELAAAGDYRTLAQNYSTQKALPPGMTMAQALEEKSDDPAIQKAMQQFADILTSAKDATPILSTDGRSARLMTTPDATQALVFTQSNGIWHIAGIETETPGGAAPDASAPKKAKANPGPGGYVP